MFIVVTLQIYLFIRDSLFTHITVYPDTLYIDIRLLEHPVLYVAVYWDNLLIYIYIYISVYPDTQHI